jgi:hypothetical protein
MLEVGTEDAAMKAKANPSRVAAATIVGALALASGCAHQYVYLPVGPGASGGAAASYPTPPTNPQGQVYVTSFGLTDLDVGPGTSGRMLHARLAVSNGSAAPWTLDGRQQTLVAPGVAAEAPAFLNTDAGNGPLYQVLPGRANVFDLYFAVPPPLDQPTNLVGFGLNWSVNANGQIMAQQTSFQRLEEAPVSYAGYPPYVAVGLGFGVGWWYGPYYGYHRAYPPFVRGYYYAPNRAWGGGWRGPPAQAWRGAPPRAWQGAPPSSGGWRGAPSRGGGGWRGAPSRGGGGHGWRGR